jgi:hypothetical protein
MSKIYFSKRAKVKQTMVGPDPHLLIPTAILDPGIFHIISLLITVPSILFSFIISWHFFRSYRFSGFGYLLGLPVGFVFLSLSFLFEHLNIIYSTDQSLHAILFWIQLASQSEALALIALSYRFKSSSTAHHYINDINFAPSAKIKDAGTLAKLKEAISSSLPLIMIAIPFIVPVSELLSDPDFSYYGLADLSLFMRIYNMTILGYILVNSIISLIKAANIKLLYIPGAFALLWLEQYSLIITYYDNYMISYIGSTLVRLAGLTLFIYMIYSVTSRGSRRKMQIETREKT